METLLKKGAYGALMDDDNAGDKFCEEDIEVKFNDKLRVLCCKYEALLLNEES